MENEENTFDQAKTLINTRLTNLSRELQQFYNRENEIISERTRLTAALMALSKLDGN